MHTNKREEEIIMRPISKMERIEIILRERPATVGDLARELYDRYDETCHKRVQHLIYQMRMRWDLEIVFNTKRKVYFLAG